MTSRRPRAADPLELDVDSIAFHQSITFDADVAELADALSRSALFRLDRDSIKSRANSITSGAEWIRFHADDEALPYPLGRVTLTESVCALDAFSDTRLMQLRRVVEEAVHHELSPDESRVVPIEDALRRPRAVWAPPTSPASDAAVSRALAQSVVRGAWPFLAHAELHGRNPAAVAATGRGRSAIEGVLERIVSSLRTLAPSFPDLTIDELREALAVREAQEEPAVPPVPPVPSRRRTS